MKKKMMKKIITIGLAGAMAFGSFVVPSSNSIVAEAAVEYGDFKYGDTLEIDLSSEKMMPYHIGNMPYYETNVDWDFNSETFDAFETNANAKEESSYILVVKAGDEYYYVGELGLITVDQSEFDFENGNYTEKYVTGVMSANVARKLSVYKDGPGVEAALSRTGLNGTYDVYYTKLDSMTFGVNDVEFAADMISYKLNMQGITELYPTNISMTFNDSSIKSRQQIEVESDSSAEAPTESESSSASTVIGGVTDKEDDTTTDKEDDTATDVVEEITIPTLSYDVHCQTYGWMNKVTNGQSAGTSGQAKRLEAIHISVSGVEDLGITYKVHAQTYGWMNWVSNGQQSGTNGQAKRLEAIQIKLTGANADKYDVYYRVHAQTYGWMDWASNGQSAGTAALAKRLEAIQIVIVEKGASAPGSTATPFVQG